MSKQRFLRAARRLMTFTPVAFVCAVSFCQAFGQTAETSRDRDPRAWMHVLPFLGTETVVNGTRVGERESFAVPALERGMVVWFR
jgi:hypothetical protein